MLSREEPLHTVASSDFGDAELGPPILFLPPMTHEIVPANKRKKGTFEKLFLEGRPPVALGVTSGGDLFGGTQVTFTDVLGDKQFNIFAASVSQYRTLSASYINLSRRLQYAIQGYSQTQFFYAYDPYAFYGIEYGYIDRDQAIATQTARGGTISGIYPLNRYTRLEMSFGFLQFSQEYNEPGLQEVADEYQQDQYGRVLFVDGQFMPLSLNLVRETTIFREYGPLAGHTLSLGYEYAPSAGSLLSRQTVEADARYYLRLGTNGVLAFRARGYKSWGEYPGYLYFGGNSEMRGYDYLAFLGNKGFFTDAELRFPIIEAALTPIGVVGGLRGVFFFNFGAAGYEGAPTTVWTDKTTIEYAAHRLRLRSDVAEPVRAGVWNAAAGLGLPPHRQPRVVRRRARNLRARLPDPLRLVVAHALQPGLGGRRVLLPRGRRRRRRATGRQHLVPQGEVQRLDRLRLLGNLNAEC